MHAKVLLKQPFHYIYACLKWLLTCTFISSFTIVLKALDPTPSHVTSFLNASVSFQMLDHFGQHLRQPPTASQSSSSTTVSRPEAISINILAAILSALRGLAEGKSKLGQDDIKKSAASLILGTHGIQIRVPQVNASPVISVVIGGVPFLVTMSNR